MSDDNKALNLNIQVQGNAEQKLKTIELKLKTIRSEQDKLLARDFGKLPAVQYQEQLLKLQEKELVLLKQKSELESLSADKRNRFLQEEFKQRQAIEQAEQNAIEARNATLAKRIRQEIDTTTLSTVKYITQVQSSNSGLGQQTQMLPYPQQLNNLNKLQGTWYQLEKETGDEKYKTKFEAVGKAIENVTLLANAYTSVKKAMQGATIAQAAFNAVSMTNPWGAIIKLVVGAGTALATYAYYTSEAADEQEKAITKQNSLITSKDLEIKMSKQQIDFMETLGGSYIQLQSNLQAVQGDEEKTANIKKAMADVTKDLTAIVGEEAAQRILSSDDIQGAITQEQQVYSDKTALMQKELDDLKAKQINLMMDSVAACNDRIGAINNEAISVDKAAKAIADSLGIVDSLLYRFHDSNAKYARSVAEELRSSDSRTGAEILADYTGSPLLKNIVNSEFMQNSKKYYQISRQNAIDSWEGHAQKEEEKKQEIANSAKDAQEKTKGNIFSKLGGVYTPQGHYNQNTTTKVIPSGGLELGGSYNREQTKSIQLQENYRTLFAEMEVSANKYSDALDALNSKESVYGKTVDITNAKYSLMVSRIQEIIKEQARLSAERDKYQEQLKDYLQNDAEFQSVAAKTIPDWSSMSLDQRTEYLDKNKEEVKQFTALYEIMQNIDTVKAKTAKTSDDRSKLQNQFETSLFAGVFDEDKQRERSLKNIDLDESIDLSKVNKRNPLYKWEETAIKIAAEKRRQEEYKNRDIELKNERDKLIIPTKPIEDEIENTNKLKDSPEKTVKLTDLTNQLTAAQQRNTAALQENADKQKENDNNKAKSAEKIKELSRETSQRIKEFWADSFIDMAQNGTSFKDIMKKMWSDLQKDAINAIFKTGRQASVTSEMFGKGKSKTGSGMPSPNKGKKLFAKNAMGGIVNVPSIAGEDGEEVIIPVEKNKQNSKKLMDYASSKLGYHPGVEKGSSYVPYLKKSELAAQPLVNVQVQQQQNHIQELEKQTHVMSAMLNHMINNPTANGNTTILPVVTQVSSEQVLEVLAKNPAALANILGSHRNSGWR